MVKIIFPYGNKVIDSNEFTEDMDVTDQRCTINDPEEMYQQYFADPDVMSDLENETIEDFDDDFYDYNDRGELGVDIARMAHQEVAAASKGLSSRKKQKAPSA